MNRFGYMVDLRAKVGTALLQVPTAGVLAFNESGDLLLVRNADDGAWGIPGGLIEPFESPADAAAREAWEETGLRVETTAILGVFGGPWCETIYPNGERISWVATIFIGRVLGGELRPDQKETTEVRFVSWEAIPRLQCREHVARFLEALDHRGEGAYFSPSTWRPPIS